MRQLLNPIQNFLQSESKGGFILFAAALLALLVANSPWAEGYFALKKTTIGFTWGDFSLQKELSSWVKDLLMAFFFLLVGLEIKREIVQGELSNPRKAMLTIVAALGGMAVPALIYVALNIGGQGMPGWGIPMATDIAFALGVLSLLGKRVPLGLKVFLTAFAIVDDLGAILVIALFYTSNLNLAALGLSLLFWGAALVLGRLQVRYLSLYFLVGALMWYFMLQSGVSPTVAAVLLALAIPIVRPTQAAQVVKNSNIQSLSDPELAHDQLSYLEASAAKAQSPLHRLEHALHPWSTYFIMPVFAFFNTGVSFAGLSFGPVALGVFLGLLIGKPLGIFLSCWLAVRLRVAVLPDGVNWPMVVGSGLLGGIGFTVSLFVAALAFPGSPLLDQAKVGVLSASVVAAVLGLWVLSRFSKSAQ